MVCKTFTVGAGNLNFIQESLFTGQLPVRMMIGMVDNDAFNGTHAKKTFNFKHFDITQLKVFMDSMDQHINWSKPTSPTSCHTTLERT